MESTSNTVTAIINNLPVATVMPFVGSSEKLAGLEAQGWLLCNGSPVKSAEYPDLYAMIGTSCGGDAVQFNLPDLQGVFLRGVDTASDDPAKQNDPDSAHRTKQGGTTVIGRQVLSRQGDEFKEHNHNVDVVVHRDHIHMANKPEYWKPAVDVRNISTFNRGGKETRPKNVYVYYIIYAGMKKTLLQQAAD